MRGIWSFLFLVATLPTLSQEPPERISGLATNELYDLHVDQKGYLWIAHGLGISRYDGLNFTNYAHPRQINLRTTDIVEDRQGRIWFHNFSGQVFYIQNGRTFLLDGYDYKGENQNPKMVLCGNELLISSYKGLFVCNTSDLHMRFFPFEKTAATAQVSLAVLRNKAVIYNNGDWYQYQQGKLQKAAVISSLSLPKDNFIFLQPATYNDTLFLSANPSGILYKLTVQDRQVQLQAKVEHHDFINAVSVDKEAWVHTRNQSQNLQTGETIPNLDLTDIVKGKDGSTWYCSRREGLLMTRKPFLWKHINFRIEAGDYVSALNANAGYFFAGTRQGNLYVFNTDSSEATWKLMLFNGLGSIDLIRFIKDDLFIVGSTTQTYIINARKKRIEYSLPIQGILDVDADGNSFYVATAAGTYVVPYLSPAESMTAWLSQKKTQFSNLQWQNQGKQAYLLFPQRTRSVRFDSLQQFVYAATKNGLLEVSPTAIRPYLINGNEVFATSIAFKKSRLYVGTVNDGLWIIEGKKILHFTTANTLASNTITRIKLTEDHLWLFEKNGIQVLNIHTNRIVENLALPDVDGANVLDIAEKGEAGYVATANGVYKVPLNLSYKAERPIGFLDHVIVNDRDTLSRHNLRLAHEQNDIQFFFSAPAFYDPESVSFRYRLKGAEEEWRVTDRGERMIRYSALAPGDYEFMLYAIDNNGLEQETAISFPFTINKPWWLNWIFIVLLNTALIGIVFLLLQNRTRQKLRMELVRRNISNDLHDDIGATLSSVNFYIDLAQSEKNNAEYLQYIKTHVNQVINSLDELVWSINPKNDTTEQLINRMKDYALPLLQAAGMQCHFAVDTKLHQAKLGLLTKRHLYLLFKEMVNNVAKHAKGRNCTIQFSHHHKTFSMVVEDDGQGFDTSRVKQHRHGLSSLQERTGKLKGSISIRSETSKGSRIAVTIPV